MRHLHHFVFALTLVVLVACGGTPATALTAEQVVERLTAAGLQVADVKPNSVAADGPVPKSFTSQASFSISEVAPSGGQVFVCDTKQNCDAIFAYYDALKALAGPYLYQSPSGTVVAQLNSGLTPETAAKYEAAIKALP